MLKLLQWNIWFKENPQSIVNEIKKINPDIVCLQEVTKGFEIHGGLDVATFISKGLDYNLHYKEAHQWTYDFKKDEVIGNAILSKYPLTQNKYFFVQSPRAEYEEVYAKQGRVYVESEIQLSSNKITVGTVHLSYTNRFETMPHQVYETEKLLALIHKKKSNYILTGDLNAIPSSDVVHKIERYLINLGPAYSVKTWPSHEIEIEGVIEAPLSWRIDYVFGTSDLPITSASTITTDISDHLPILVEINI